MSGARVGAAAFHRGVEHFNCGRVLRARHDLAIAARGGGPEAAWACQQLVQSFEQRGHGPQAERVLRALLDRRRALLDWSLGYLFRRRGRDDEAEALLERAAQARPRVTAALVELAWFHDRRGRAAEARRLLSTSLLCFRRRGDGWGVATVLVQKAALAIAHAELARAVELAAEAARLRQACGDRFGLGFAHQVRGKALYLLSDYTAAMQAWREALHIHLQAGHLRDAAAVLNNLGLCHRDLADPARAVEEFRAARRIFRRIGEPWREAVVLANLAHACRQLGDLRACAGHYRAALALLAGGASADAFGIALGELAEAYTRTGQPARALAVLGERGRHGASGLQPRTRVDLLIERARAELVLGRPAAAMRSARRAIERGQRLRGAQRSRLAPLLRAETVLGQALLAAGRRRPAVEVLRRAGARIETLLGGQTSPAVRIGLIEAYKEVHDALVASLLAAGRPGLRAAWSVSARVKARELLGHGGLPPAAHRHPEHEDAERQFRELVFKSRLSRSERARLGAVRRRLEDSDRRSRTLPAPSRRAVLPLRRLAAWLGPERCLIEYLVSDATTIAFALSQDRADVHDLGLPGARLAREVNRLLAPLLEAAAHEDPRADLDTLDAEAAHRLWAALLGPVLAALPPAARHLIIVPDGPLHALPFELLAVDPGAPDRRGLPPIARYASARYAGDEYTISYARSTWFLASGVPGAAVWKPRRLLALAFSPDGDTVIQTPEGSRTAAPLPGVGEELEVLGSFFPERTILSGTAACAREYERSAPGHDAIHIAAHAIADPGAPGLSGVIVAPDPGRPGANGFLTAERIRQVPLAAQLVTLSACDSGRGRLRAREGPLGLVSAFLEAGAASVLASLWPVDDASTRRLMQGFYRRLCAGEDRATALARAKRELRQEVNRYLFPERSHPFFWAAFVLIDHAPPR